MTPGKPAPGDLRQAKFHRDGPPLSSRQTNRAQPAPPMPHPEPMSRPKSSHRKCGAFRTGASTADSSRPPDIERAERSRAEFWPESYRTKSSSYRDSSGISVLPDIARKLEQKPENVCPKFGDALSVCAELGRPRIPIAASPARFAKMCCPWNSFTTQHVREHQLLYRGQTKRCKNTTGLEPAIKHKPTVNAEHLRGCGWHALHVMREEYPQ